MRVGRVPTVEGDRDKVCPDSQTELRGIHWLPPPHRKACRVIVKLQGTRRGAERSRCKLKRWSTFQPRMHGPHMRTKTMTWNKNMLLSQES